MTPEKFLEEVEWQVNGWPGREHVIGRQLIAIARRQEKALEFYASGKHLMNESQAAPGNVCPPIGHYARAAQADVAKIIKGEG